MSDESVSTAPKSAKAEPLLACTVLVSGTVIGPLTCGKGHRLQLPKSKAETLAGLTPPRVRIDGI